MENFVARGGRRGALFFTTLAFFMGFAGVSAYGPVVPILKKTLQLSPFFMSLLAAAPALTGSLLRIPFGAMVDSRGGKRPILLLFALSIIGIAGMAWLTSLPPEIQTARLTLFIGFGMLAGCGIATFSVGVPAISYWHPQKRQGSALAIYGGLGNIAPGLFAILLPLLITRLGFGYSYTAWLSILLLTGAIIAVFMHDAPSFQLKRSGYIITHEDEERRRILKEKFGQELLPSGNAARSLKLAATAWSTWALTIIYFATFGGFIALTAWLPAFWSQGFQTGAVMAGLLTAVYSISTSLVRVAGGFLSDRFGGERVLGISLAVMLAGSIAMTVSGSFTAALAAEIVMALGMGAGNAAVFKLVPKFAPATVGGTAGIVGGLGAFGGFVIPLLLGVIISRYQTGYAQAFAVFIVLSVISMITLKTLRGGRK